MTWRLVGVILALGSVAGVAAGADGFLDPDELAAMLADLEASGGVLTGEELADLQIEEPGGTSSSGGTWRLTLDTRQEAGPRTEVRARRDAPGWGFALRHRRDAAGSKTGFWLRAGARSWRLGAGGGAPAHGGGLVAAPPSGRGSLSADASLWPARPGWRPTTATTLPARLAGVNLAHVAARGEVAAGFGRDADGGPVRYLRGRLGSEDTGLAAFGIARDIDRGGSVAGRWRRGSWRLFSEVASWRRPGSSGDGHAWLTTVRQDVGRWRGEFQAAVSRAGGGLVGARRPACLGSWRGQGWAVRVTGRAGARTKLDVVYGVSIDRDDVADRQRRVRVGIGMSGRWADGGDWEVRVRRQDETWWRRDPQQSWLPAALDDRRQRTWFVVRIGRPCGGGRGRLAWRRLEESGLGRSLLAASWRRDYARVRIRAGIDLAWGDPLDLVSVIAPVSGLVRMQHWGHWDAETWLGCEGRGRHRWQMGIVSRRRSEVDGGGVVTEARLGWGGEI